MNLIKFLAFAAFALLEAGCTEDIQKNEPISFEFQLLDEKGNPSTVFNEGENIVFDFQIINNTDVDCYFYQHKFNTERFLEVYSADKVSLGKPYRSIFCDKIGLLIIEPKSALSVKASWITDSNCCDFPYLCGVNKQSILPKGKYSTGFEGPFTFRFSGSDEDQYYIIDNIGFQINFEVI